MPRLTSRGTQDERVVAEECPVALVFDGTTIAVLMATPSDLTDLALGFSLTEGLIEDAGEIEDLSVVPAVDGIEVRTWLRPRAGRLLKDRRRRLVGPTGCGLCGVESLAEANRMHRIVVRQTSLTPEQIQSAIEGLGEAQCLNHATRATHAAGFFRPDDEGHMILREDVGRHNALDKLAGALASQGISGASGAVILTSRISVEMVQKAAAIGVGIVVAISAPTALAIRTAETGGVTLIGVARGSDFEIFSHPAGVVGQATMSAASAQNVRAEPVSIE
ncbi:formate dehydrogenase accessory sulfurtransferase FdhD [Bradyrhizobium sp. INPA01-394B]|uniref:Sulfur carrier protein FdhD n=1 Tax=Bradyrhizobium campsiandrae TaxID=1729892 RepID=A0ABR7U706_9BRAD|nr:formate dehydrogenase accessory sulfurtransferase FdhD [Bradyrhizobium campsiandrae]MBC9876792.1 formate dehydrogenase accessory sulfurtransferase FdhD [Bradyrhizobium campsiandrae]MBC9979306.1 formate dehydrogenase accessory sulfurtransferase FdhD [Bradyrhizobium campsiandrae]